MIEFTSPIGPILIYAAAALWIAFMALAFGVAIQEGDEE